MERFTSTSYATLDRPTWVKRALLYIFVLAVVLLPINFNNIKYVILVAFLAMFANVVWRLVRRPRVPYSPVYFSIALFTLIYSIWVAVSLYYGNNLAYLLKDSAGFLVYLVFPVLYIFVVTNQLTETLGRALIITAFVVFALNAAAFILYYLVFGALTYPKLLAVNAGLASFGFSWDLGASNGVLRGNTRAGHFMLMGIALLTYRYSRTKRMGDLMLIGILMVGTLLDGHKALLVATAIFVVMVSPLIVLNVDRRPLKLMPPVFLGVSILFVTFIMFVDLGAFIERFSDLGSGSFQVRNEQVGSLLVEMGKRPMFGNGFGASASIIRSDLRPFMYEVDFLAVAMKLGAVGSIAYFLVYIGTIAWPLLRGGSNYYLIMFSLGMSYLFYMGTNGGFAMSPISSFFHLLLFMCVSMCVLPTDSSGFSVQRNELDPVS